MSGMIFLVCVVCCVAQLTCGSVNRTRVESGGERNAESFVRAAVGAAIAFQQTLVFSDLSLELVAADAVGLADPLDERTERLDLRFRIRVLAHERLLRD